MVDNSRDLPRYRRLADNLRRDIARGRWSVGETLPTEMALCEEHGVSRHTVREALRLLAEDRLIERRQGAGSVVSDAPAPVFAQATGDFNAILQYARDAAFSLVGHGEGGDDMLAAVGLSGSYCWYRGLRGLPQEPPIAATLIFIAGEFAPTVETVSDIDCSYSEWIERTSDVRIEQVEQRIEAVAIDPETANLLSVAPDSAGLLTVRRYRDAGGRVVMLSESVHPAGRFAYTQQMRRERGATADRAR